MTTILIVEDEPIIREGITHLVKITVPDVRILLAANGEEALILCYQGWPDLILTDVRMPVMDGVELTRKIRKYNQHVPVLAISGFHDFPLVREAFVSGISDYVTKPINRIQFVSLIRTYLPKEERIEKRDDTGLEAIFTYIEDHLHRELTLQEVANAVYLHPQYISQLFRTKTGQTFSQFRMEKRISRAKELLRGSQLKIYEVASLSGFPNFKHFCRVFKEHTGRTPKEFRKCPT
ncbi:response regulator [Neobacillus sp.]|uniref:response regulator n=1 Tax=Neobacillus sp. TaxID=2675273 RepID=UPI00289E58E8|nr:response regulator [Neobacillus sp.]